MGARALGGQGARRAGRLAALLAALACGGAAARAEPRCLAGPAGDPFPTCFDPGRRLVVGASAVGEAGQGGVRGAVDLAALARHVVATDDPAVWWRLEHVVLEASARDGALDGALYRGRFIRHSRDGRIVLPTSPPRKIFLPFDLGAEAEVGAIAARDGGDRLELGVVRTGLFIEVLRSPSFRRRVAIGAAARWDVSGALEAGELSAHAHRVAPFSLAMAALHLESASGLTVLDLAGEGGRTWSSERGWHAAGSAHASLERVVIALDDRPLSIYARASAGTAGTLLEGRALVVGLRLGLIAAAGPPR